MGDEFFFILLKIVWGVEQKQMMCISNTGLEVCVHMPSGAQRLSVGRGLGSLNL